MKHLFYVHSGITWLIAQAIIEETNIAGPDVIIMLGRGVSFDNLYCCYSLDSDEQQLAFAPSYGSKKVLSFLSTLTTLDRKIARLVGNSDFLIYLPTERNYLMQFLQTHRLCVGRNFMEEGLLTYNESFLKHGADQSLSARLQYLIRTPFHLNRTLVGTNNKTRYSPDTFTIFVCTIAAVSVLRSFTVQQVNIAPYVKKYPSATLQGYLFVFDPVVEKQICEKEVFLRCFNNFIQKQIPSLSSRLAVKFHPQQSSFEMYLDVFNGHNIDYYIVPQDVIPEALLLGSSNVMTLGLCSSVLFYAWNWGHAVSTFSAELARESDSYDDWVRTSIPPFIINSLKLL
jgi:hypothetical protein